MWTYTKYATIRLVVIVIKSESREEFRVGLSASPIKPRKIKVVSGGNCLID